MYGLELTPEHQVATLSDLAVDAERAGFDAAFVSHHYNNRDQFMALTDIARETDDLLVGPGIANPYETHPVTLASRMATLDELSSGRGLFGVGPGDRSTLANLGYDQDSALRRTLETFKVAQQLWTGERVDHDGTFQATDAALNYEVGSIPVYVGAQGPHMTRMAAKHADGVLFNGSHPRDYEWAAEQVAHGLDDRPESHGEFDFAAYASVSIADEEAAARDAARPPVAFIAGSAAPPLLDRHDLDHDRASEIGDAISRGDFEEAFGTVTPAMIDAFCIAGTPTDVEQKIDGVLDHADSFVAGSPLGPDLETAIELLGAVCDRFDSA